MRVQHIKHMLIASSILILGGCASLIESGLSRQANQLSLAMQNHNDPQTVIQAMPAYLLLMDSLAQDQNASQNTLMSSAAMYTAYSSLIGVSDSHRAKNLSQRALDYATRALCIDLDQLCVAMDAPYAQFEKTVLDMDFSKHPQQLYSLVQTMGGWIQARTDDWDALAKVARVRLLSEKLYALDPEMDNGGLAAILGLLNALLPPSYGGKPEVARNFFEQSLVISHGYNLSYKVMYAKFYARQVFNQTLHDDLLKQVLAADPKLGDQQLINLLAQAEAKNLLEQSVEYF
ncbi:MAG: TRAP transporter TatT component family protein [bacterium]